MGSASIRTFPRWMTVQRGTERCHFRVLLLDGEKDAPESKHHRLAKKHVIKVNNFPFIFIVHIKMIVLLSRKQELTNEF